MRYLRYFLFIFFLLLFVVNINAEPNNSLDFDAIKGKYIDVDINLTIPITINRYTPEDHLTFKTPIFYDSRSQKVTSEAYYYDNLNEKVYADIVKDEYGNSIAIFEIDSIQKPKYVFYINANVISENKIVLNNTHHSLDDPINDYNLYKESTRNMQSHASEIISLTNAIKESNNSLKEIVNVTNWVHNNIDYNLDYSYDVIDAITVLENRAGVCDEFANITGALLRAKGFPVKYVSGYANSTLDWEAHAWLEVYVPNQGWIPVDATYGEVATVDASHIVISKSTDPSDIKDIVETTSDIDIIFGKKEKSFKINEQKSFCDMGYSNVLQLKFITEEKMKEQSIFNIKARVKNTNATPLVNLLVLQTHNSFTQIYPKENELIVYLDPFEEKEINYYYLLPSIDNPMTYSFVFATQINNFTEYVNIYKNQGLFSEAFFLLDPVFYFKNKQLAMDLKIINYTKEDKQLYFDFNLNGNIITEKQDIPLGNILEYSRTFDKIDEGNLNFVVSGDYDYSKIIKIYSDNIKIIDYNISKHSEQSDDNKQGDDSDIYDINNTDTNDIWSYIDNIKVNDKPNNDKTFAIVVISLFLLVTFFILFSKSKKS